MEISPAQFPLFFALLVLSDKFLEEIAIIAHSSIKQSVLG
jgi:hypothetical protein